MILAIECIVICILFYVINVVARKSNPLAGIHNLPLKIQQRVQELPEYKDSKPPKVLSTKERIIKKIPALIVVLILFIILIYLAGARNFIDAVKFSCIMWISIKLFVVFIIDILWYSNSPKYWIKKTEDLENEYKNYKFYISSIPRSILAGFVVSLIVGVVINIICK